MHFVRDLEYFILVEFFCTFCYTSQFIDPLVKVKHIFIDLEIPLYDRFGVKYLIRREGYIGIHCTIEVEIGIRILFVQT